MSKIKKSFIQRAAERVGIMKAYQVMVDLKINGRVVMHTSIVVHGIGSGDASRKAEKIALENCPVTAAATNSKVLKGDALNKILNKINSTDENEL